MRVRFWGTRGSIPVAMDGRQIRHKIKQALRQADGRRFDSEAAIEQFIDDELSFPIRHTYGGHSACVEIIGGADYMICDMGSGLHAFGQQVMTEFGPGQPQVYHFFMSHVHWDHIMGFPFFPPAYIPGNTIRIHGCHDVIEAALRQQHADPCFPVQWAQLGATIEFIRLKPNQTYDINGFQVRAKLQPHHGDSYGYRFEKDGKSVVYSTDGEHKQQSVAETEAMVAFYRDADLVVFDAMYSLADMVTVKEDWGHSSNIVGVDLCLRANVKHYCMFHHEPAYDDDTIDQVLQDTRRYAELARQSQTAMAPERQSAAQMKVSTAYDGLSLTV